MFNPDIKFAKSKGVDLPIMYVYLGGYMSGEKLQETLYWRKYIRSSYKNYEESAEGNIVSFPIAFLDPYNGKEFESIDAKGLESSLSPNAIYNGDYMSVQKADIIIANMNTFGSDRPMIGTIWELGWADEMRKPFILIVDKDKRETYEKHPFTRRASNIVCSLEELVEKQILETFYRRIAGAIY